MTRAALIAGLVAVLLGWPATPASANPKGGCPLGRICLYIGRGYTGERHDVGGDQAGPCTPLATPVWSAVNRSGPRAGTPAYLLRLFRDPGCTQPASTVAPEAARADTAGARSFVLECRPSAGC